MHADDSSTGLKMEVNDAVKIVNSTLLLMLNTIDQHCEQLKPWQIILYTLTTVYVIMRTKSFLFKREKTLHQRFKKSMFKLVKKMPIVGQRIAEKVAETKSMICAEKLFKLKPGMRYLQSLPSQGFSDQHIMQKVDEYLSMDEVRWTEGKVSGAVYFGDPKLTDLLSEVIHKFTWSNPLHADVFQGLRKMEAEVIRMSCAMFHGHPQESCGCVTSGGTESILLAAKAYRDWANDRGIEYPEIVCPVSAHAAFEKAAHYFKMKLVQVPLEPKSWKVDMRKMKKAITSRTCMLVGSAPNFPHGIIDPISDIAALGQKYGIPVHVDACLGGFLIAFMEGAKFPLPPFDFRVPGVTSISADTHKYGFTPKGTSCILYSSPKWRTHQYFVSTDWQGGMYATPTLGGSRNGATIAATWATMVRFGLNGYINTTQKIVSTLHYITKHLRDIDNIYVFGEPQVSVVAIGSLDFDIFLLSSAMVELGWNLNSLQFPAAIHLCVTMLHTKPGVADQFLSDVRKSVAQIMLKPRQKNSGAAAMYGMAQTIPDRSIVSELTGSYLDACYDTRDVAKPLQNGIH